MLVVHFEQIEGELIWRGIDIMELTARQAINFTASWFLGFYEPAQWSKVIEHLEANIDATPVKTEQGTLSVPRDAIGQLKALVAEAHAGAEPEARSGEPA